MPVLAGWITGEQVPQEIIDQTLLTMGEVLGRHGGQPARTTQPGTGLIAFADSAFGVQRNDEPPVLDWVPERRTLTYRRPLSGAHALYYMENWPAEGNLLFASEIKALLAVGAPRKLNLAALDSLLRYGFIPAPWTAFEGIFVVPAGSILRWQRAQTILNHATDFHLETSVPVKNALEQFEAELKDAIHSLLPSEQSGVDQIVSFTGSSPSSTLVSALLHQYSSLPLTISSLGYAKNIRARAWQAAQHIADTLQRPFLAITSVDQPAFWSAAIMGIESPTVDTQALAWHQLLHTTTTIQPARVAFSALGAHMLFATYTSNPVHNSMSTSTAPQAPHSQLSDYSSSLVTRREKTSVLWSQEVAKALKSLEPWETTLHARKLERKATQIAQRAQDQAQYYLDLHLRLPDLLVNQALQLAIQEKMVLRSPFLHPHMLDLVTRLPFALPGPTTKAALVEELAARYISPFAGPKLPLTVPITSLFEDSSHEIVQQTLSREALQNTGLFDIQAVENLRQQKGRSASTRELLFVFTTQLFYQLFGMSLT